MRQGDNFDGGGLLSLLGFEDEDPSASAPAEPRHMSPRPEPRQAPRAAPPAPAQPSERPAPARSGMDLSTLSSDELVRAIVLADVLGPPPGRRG